MFNKNKITSVFFILFIVSLIGFIGCEKESEPPENQKELNKEQNADSISAAKEENKIPDLKGTWSGSFDSHNATLKITDQNKNEIKGSLTVAYRSPMNKKISGTIDISNNELSMKDIESSRSEGTYDALLSEDMEKISGTFITKVDGKSADFTFSKK